MLEKTANEFRGIQGQGPQASAAGFFVGERDAVLLDFEDTVIGDGHLEDVGGKIVHRRFGIGYGLAVDIEVLFPDGGGDLIE